MTQTIHGDYVLAVKSGSSPTRMEAVNRHARHSKRCLMRSTNERVSDQTKSGSGMESEKSGHVIMTTQLASP